MKIVALVPFLVLGCLAMPLAAEAQQGGRVWRVGRLGWAPPPQPTEAFSNELRELGYVEGKDQGGERTEPVNKNETPGARV